jgi:hypothetical protein
MKIGFLVLSIFLVHLNQPTIFTFDAIQHHLWILIHLWLGYHGLVILRMHRSTGKTVKIGIDLPGISCTCFGREYSVNWNQRTRGSRTSFLRWFRKHFIVANLVRIILI